MDNIKFPLLSLIMASALAACGGGGGGSDSDGSDINPSSEISWLLPVSEGTRKITLLGEENVIYGYGCTAQKFYNLSGEFIGGRDYYDGFTLAQPLPKGEYTVAVNEIFSDTNNSNGILYFLSSDYNVDTIVFGNQYSLSENSVKLLKFSLSEARSIASNSYDSVVRLYDAQLNPIVFNSGSTATVLSAGTYYVLGYHGSINSCRYDKPGVVSLIDLGVAS